MRAVVVTPGKANSGRLADVPDPEPADGQVLVEVLEVGVCGTDSEILQGLYGSAPPGEAQLVLGHENFGRVLSAPDGSGFSPGDLVACEVRRPDPVPCVACGAGRQDLCVNGQFTERGIKGRHGFMSDRYVEWPEYLVPVPAGLEPIGVLLEPLSVVEKGIIEAFTMRRRIPWEPREAVVTGAGPIGLMATFLLRSLGLEVSVVDRNPRGGLTSAVVEGAGAHYVQSDEATLPELASRVDGIDLLVEATAVPEIVFGAIDAIGPNGVLCLTGVSAGSRKLEVPAAKLNLGMVLENKVVFGTVNASRRDWDAAARDLASFESTWPGLCARLLTRRAPAERFGEVVERQDDDIKNTVVFAGTL